jgi:hypothetical protein
MARSRYEAAARERPRRLMRCEWRVHHPEGRTRWLDTAFLAFVMRLQRLLTVDSSAAKGNAPAWSRGHPRRG